MWKVSWLCDGLLKLYVGCRSWSCKFIVVSCDTLVVCFIFWIPYWRMSCYVLGTQTNMPWHSSVCMATVEFVRYSIIFQWTREHKWRGEELCLVCSVLFNFTHNKTERFLPSAVLGEGVDDVVVMLLGESWVLMIDVSSTSKFTLNESDFTVQHNEKTHNESLFR